jgi:hypothetical protein
MKWWAYMFVLLKKRPLAQLSLKRTHTNTPGKLKAERGCFAAALVKSRGFNWKAKYVICVGVLWWMRNACAMREPLSGGRWIIAKDCLLIAFCCWWGRERRFSLAAHCHSIFVKLLFIQRAQLLLCVWKLHEESKRMPVNTIFYGGKNWKILFSVIL